MWVVAYVVGGLLALGVSAATLPSTGEDPSTQTTTTEEPERTGDLKFGDKCTATPECGFRGSTCTGGFCACRPELVATNHIDKCGHEVDINGTCFFNEQCEARTRQTECRDQRCMCMFEMKPIINKHNQVECIADYVAPEPEKYLDPTMIGVLVGMALMFIIICVVLRLFSKARWNENRTIFNTPNPRLMNVSLLRDHAKPGTGERRGSRCSTTKPPSRQPSLASLRPTSPSQSHDYAEGEEEMLIFCTNLFNAGRFRDQRSHLQSIYNQNVLTLTTCERLTPKGSRVSPRGSFRGSRSSSGSVKSPVAGAQRQDPPNTAQA